MPARMATASCAKSAATAAGWSSTKTRGSAMLRSAARKWCSLPGMIFTIEPMVNMGTDEVGTHPGNTWEIFTADGKPSAQWEIMVLVTDTGHEVLSW